MKLKVAFLDVFHGDCAVVTFDERGSTACIVVDGGETKDAAKRLAAYLKDEGIEVIDLMVVTHIDADHVVGLRYLLEDESGKSTSWNKGKKRCIRHYWGPKPDPGYKGTETNTGARAAAPGAAVRMLDYVIQGVDDNQHLHGLVERHIFDKANICYPSLADPPALDIFDNIGLMLLAPDSQIEDTDIKKKALTISNVPYKARLEAGGIAGARLTLSDLRRIVAMNAEEMAVIANRTANNQSIVFKLSPKQGTYSKAKKWTFLFTGDAEHESWNMMKGRAGIKANLPARVLKVPHHGSVNGMDSESLMIIKPKYSIVSVGQKHGLPDGTTLGLIRKSKSRRLFCTERNTKSNGPCWDAGGQLMTGCVRGDKSCFRSLAFKIDTDTGSESISAFAFEPSSLRIETKTEDIWCGASGWKSN